MRSVDADYVSCTHTQQCQFRWFNN